jgi:hypothetical protein
MQVEVVWVRHSIESGMQVEVVWVRHSIESGMQVEVGWRTLKMALAPKGGLTTTSRSSTPA